MKLTIFSTSLHGRSKCIALIRVGVTHGTIKSQAHAHQPPGGTKPRLACSPSKCSTAIASASYRLTVGKRTNDAAV